MLSSSLRASRPLLARVARQQAVSARRSLFTPSAVRSADLVQDMYLRELKGYKAPQVKASDAKGAVLEFAVPKAPASPEETNLAADLKAYETQTVEVEGQAASSETGAAPVEEDWFEEEEEEPKAAAH